MPKCRVRATRRRHRGRRILVALERYSGLVHEVASHKRRKFKDGVLVAEKDVFRCTRQVTAILPKNGVCGFNV